MNPSPTSTTRRYPWLAAFLSLLMPGLGQLYCGAFVRGLCFTVLSAGTAMLGIVALVPRLQLSGSVLAAIEGVSLVTYAISIFDAFRLARRIRVDYIPKDYNRWYAYVLLGLAVSCGHLFAMLYAREHLIQPFRLAAQSMYPTLWQGDQVMAARNAFAGKDPAPGDIVVFHNPDDRSQVFAKRVVAVAGDSVEIRDDHLYVNGIRLELTTVPAPSTAPAEIKAGRYFEELNRGAKYRIYFSGIHRRWKNLAAMVVPPHACFVMGDNRDESLDSRSFGPIPLIGIVGKVTYRYAPFARLGTLQ
jgi:signal peptidase I